MTEHEQELLRRGVLAVLEVVNNSHGVYGLHLNGDPSPWDELRTGGRFDASLKDFDAAVEVCKKQEVA